MNLFVAIAVVVVFGALVTLHEFGHFIVAKLNGVRVLEFSVGFGSPLFKVQRKGTTYALRTIPLGGYVRLAGMDDGDDSPQSFNKKPVWRRVTIIAAGATTNLLLPIPIFFAVVMLLSGPVTVTQLLDNTPAQRAGIPLGAEVTAVDGHPVSGADEMRQLIRQSGGRPIAVDYRDPSIHQVMEKTITPEKVAGVYRIGVGTTKGGGYDVPGALGEAVVDTRDAILGTVGGLVAIVTGHIPGGLGGNCGPSGPIGIVRATATAAQEGIVPLLEFMAILSVNLGILNLLPLPALDGGRLAFLVVEGVRRRPVDPSKEQRFHYAGLLVLLSLVLVISLNDIARFGTPFAALVKNCGG